MAFSRDVGVSSGSHYDKWHDSLTAKKTAQQQARSGYTQLYQQPQSEYTGQRTGAPDRPSGNYYDDAPAISEKVYSAYRTALESGELDERALRSELDVLTAQLDEAKKQSFAADRKSRLAASVFEQPEGIVGRRTEQYANAQERAYDAAKAGMLVEELDGRKRKLEDVLGMIDYIKYTDCVNASDFAEYSKKGAAIANPSFSDAENSGVTILGRTFGAPKVQNAVTYSRSNADAINLASLKGLRNGDGGSRQGDIKYTYMTDMETDIYNYYLGKGETEKAGEYLKYLENTLSRRMGQKLADTIAADESRLGRGAAYGGLAAFSGTRKFLDDTAQMFRKERMPESYLQHASRSARERLSGAGGAAYDAVNMLGYMAPELAASAFAAGIAPAAGRVVGSTAYGLSSAGDAYGQALDEGYSPEQARKYGFGRGSMNAGLQYLISGMPAMGGKWTESKLAELAPRIKSPVQRGAVNILGRANSAGAENVLQELGDAQLRRFYLNEERYPTPEELLNAYLSAAMTSAVANLPGEAMAAAAEYGGKAGASPGADTARLPDVDTSMPPEYAYGDWPDDLTPDGRAGFDSFELEPEELPLELTGEMHKSGGVALLEKGESSNDSTIDNGGLISYGGDDINDDIAERRYRFVPNEFGNFGKRGGGRCRILHGGLEAAEQFFDEYTRGYVFEEIEDHGIKRVMEDGTVYFFRSTSNSGSPAVNMKYPNGKKQKIHFNP